MRSLLVAGLLFFVALPLASVSAQHRTSSVASGCSCGCGAPIPAPAPVAAPCSHAVRAMRARSLTPVAWEPTEDVVPVVAVCAPIQLCSMKRCTLSSMLEILGIWSTKLVNRQLVAPDCTAKIPRRLLSHR